MVPPPSAALVRAARKVPRVSLPVGANGVGRGVLRGVIPIIPLEVTTNLPVSWARMRVLARRVVRDSRVSAKECTMRR